MEKEKGQKTKIGKIFFGKENKPRPFWMKVVDKWVILYFRIDVDEIEYFEKGKWEHTGWHIRTFSNWRYGVYHRCEKAIHISNAPKYKFDESMERIRKITNIEIDKDFKETLNTLCVLEYL